MIDTELKPQESLLDAVEEYQRGISDGFGSVGNSPGKASRKALRLYCFSCHRTENHYNTLKGKSYHYLLIGMTMGLVWLFGAYRCRCCGHRRLVRFNNLNLRYHYHRWKYAGKFNTNRLTVKPVYRQDKSSNKQVGVESDSENGTLNGESSIHSNASINGNNRRRRKRKLKSVPSIDSIGRERRQRQEKLQVEQLTTGYMDFSIESLVQSLETDASRKLKAELEAASRIREPLIARKAKPRKQINGKPKRRYAKKERLSGPNLYCFGCKQNNQHFHRFKGTPFYFFLFGITLGLIAIIGPFRCSICTRNRLFGLNLLNPKYYVRRYIERIGDGYG